MASQMSSGYNCLYVLLLLHYKQI